MTDEIFNTPRVRTPRATHNTISMVLIIATIVFIGIHAGLNDEDTTKLISKLIMLTLYWNAVNIFIKFYRTRKYNVEEALSQNPVGLGLFLGLFALGTALVIIFG